MVTYNQKTCLFFFYWNLWLIVRAICLDRLCLAKTVVIKYSVARMQIYNSTRYMFPNHCLYLNIHPLPFNSICYCVIARGIPWFSLWLASLYWTMRHQFKCNLIETLDCACARYSRAHKIARQVFWCFIDGLFLIREDVGWVTRQGNKSITPLYSISNFTSFDVFLSHMGDSELRGIVLLKRFHKLQPNVSYNFFILLKNSFHFTITSLCRACRKISSLVSVFASNYFFFRWLP